MFVEGSKFKFYDPETLDALIKAGTLDRTILGSALGQVGNLHPVEGFRAVIGTCLDLGYGEDDTRKMVSTNDAGLCGLPLDESTDRNSTRLYSSHQCTTRIPTPVCNTTDICRPHVE